MKRIDLLTDLYLAEYIKELDKKIDSGKDKVIYLRPDSLDLRKMSLKLPKRYMTQKEVIPILGEKIRSMVVNMLGYSCGETVYGDWVIFFKREGLTYSREVTREHLRNL